MTPGPVRQPIAAGRGWQLWRRVDEGLAVAVKTHDGALAAPLGRARTHREFEILKSLTGTATPRALRLEVADARPALVLQDLSAYRPLSELVASSVAWPLEQFFPLAVQLIAAVAEIHQAGVVHKNLRPEHVLVGADGKVLLFGFEEATRMEAEEEPFDAAQRDLGALRYASPEQTGRMNRLVDYRSDLYSLGLVLYELLNGTPPFVVTDAVGALHAHVALAPPPLRPLRPDVPEALEAVVQKLLAKTPDLRYQNAFALEEDLRQVADAWRAGRTFPVSALGQTDRGAHLAWSQQLYGRDDDARRLIELFRRAAVGPLQLALVSGPSGVGKTSLVHETHRPLAECAGYFAAGKFDRHERVNPYSGLRRALAELIEQIADDRPAVRAAITRELLEGLGGSAAALVEVIPELSTLCGPIAPSPDAGGDTGVRFRLAVRRLVELLARPEHPVVLFLDDLQWADAASLRLFEDLAGADELRHLLLIGAYRDDELTAGHPLLVALERLRDEGAPVTHFTLAPLTVEHVHRLIVDSLHGEHSFSGALAQHVHAETEGNPFFVRRLLGSLRDDLLLQFSFRENRWVCDQEALGRREVSPTVVDLMVRQLKRLPEPTVEALTLAACIGSTFDLHTLASLCGLSPHAAQERLWPAVHARMLTTLEGREWTELGVEGASLVDAHASHISYRFRHDRVQQAAYSLTPGERLPDIHLALCRLFQATAVKDERLFETAGHCMRALSTMAAEDERADSARLLLRAAARANATNAAAAAREYCWAAEQAVPAASQYDGLRFEAARQLGESEVLLGEHQAAQRTFQRALGLAPTRLERAAIFTLQMEMWVSCGELKAALDTLIAALRLFDLHIDASNVAQVAQGASASVQRARRGRSVDDLVQAPDSTDPEMVALLDLLGRAIDTAFMNGRDWVVAVTSTGVVTALAAGGSLASSMTFATYGLVDAEPPTAEGFLRRAEYGRIGALLAERHGVPAWISRANVSNPQHFAHPFRQAVEAFDRAADAGWSSAALTWGAYAEVRALFMMLAAGVPLARIEAERAHRVIRVRRARRSVSEVCCDALGEFVVALVEPSDEPWFLGGSAQRAAAVRERALLSGPWAACHFLSLQHLLAVIHERWALARDTALALASMAHASLGMAHEHLGLVLEAFTVASTVPVHDRAGRADAEDRLRAAEQSLESRASLNADFLPGLHALRAARAEVGHDVHRALEHYHRCVEATRTTEQTYLRAMACERASVLAERMGWPSLARFYLTEAHGAWLAWGAPARASELVKRFPSMFAGGEHEANAFPAADVESLLKSVRAISGELRLSELLKRLVHIVLENAGAQRGLLVLERDGVAVVEAESVVEGSRVVTTLPSVPLSSDDVVAHALVHRTLRTGEMVSVDDVAHEKRFGLSRATGAGPRSTLTLPIDSQGRRLGVLHLENRVASHAFHVGARRVLWLLVSQAVTALENARLYGNLQKEIEERRRTEAALRTERDNTATMLENLPLLACAMSSDGRMAFVNPMMARAVGAPRDSLVGQSWWDTLHAEPRERAALRHQLETQGTVRAFETTLVDRAGLPRVISWTCLTTGRREDGALLFCFGEDVTDERRRAREQKELEEHLRRAQQLETVGTLASGIAHDFNNILVPISSYADLLVGQLPAGSEPQQFAQEISTASARATDLVRRILSASRKVTPVRRPVSLQEIAQEVCRLLEPSLGSTISLRVELDAGCPAVVGDAGQLHQAFLNLGTNAGHAMRERGGSLTVSVARGVFPPGEQEGRPAVVVSFADTGHGMDEATLARIFDPFFTTKPVGEGTGLGLWVVHGVVQNAHGAVRVESQLRVGTTFRLFFPLSGAQAEPEARPPAPLSVAGRERLLVVDDESAVARVVVRALSRLGYQVSAFNNPIEALEAFRAAPAQFDAVVTDFSMPHLDGLALAQALTAIRPVPIVLTSGLFVERSPEELAALGIRSILNKPVTMTALAAAIRSVIDSGA